MGLTRLRAEQISNIDYKQAVRVITVTNVTLSGGAPTPVDGVNLSAGDRVLVTGQSTGSQNGIYQVETVGTGSNGTWIRSTDTNATGELEAGAIVMVTEGTVYADSQWKLTTDNPIVIGTMALTFEQNSAFAFGNILANSTAVLATTVGSTVTFSPGSGIQITGNNTTKTVTIEATGTATVGSISNGTSNVNVVSSGGNVTVGVGGSGNIAEFSTTGVRITGVTSASGNVTGGNVLTAGVMSSTGNITGGNLIAGTGASGNITGANVITANTVTATANITAGNILTTGLISATGAITGAAITGTSLTLSTGNITGGNLLLSGAIIDSAQLDIQTSAANANIALAPNGTGIVTVSTQVSAVGNVTGGNLTTAGLVSATGNITGAFILGNGSQLTGVDATQIVNGTSNAKVVSSGGNIAVGIGGVANVAVFSSTGIFITGVNSVTANVTGGNILTAGLISATGAITGAAMTGTSLTVSTGNITGGNLLLSGAIIDSAQLDIQTSAANANIALAPNGIGMVTVSTQVSAVGNVTGGNLRTAGLISATGAIQVGGDMSLVGNIVDTGPLTITTSSSGNITLSPNGTGNINTTANIMPSANATANIGSTSFRYNTIFGLSTSAQYADLAEKYTADADYVPGTVLEFGGDQEVTATNTSHSPRVAGIVSTLPSYIMNDGLVGDHTAMVSLTGRVPCLVQGPIAKGDRLVASAVVGHAQRLDPAQYEPGCIIGKALEDYPSTAIGTIEVAVGRF